MAPGGDTNDGGTLTPPPSLPPSSNPPGNSLRAPPLPTLASELVEEILCRLPVKSLLRFRCVCKSWNSLIISDPKFARKHRREYNRFNLIIDIENHLGSYPVRSAFDPDAATRLEYPPNYNVLSSVIFSSCDGILCSYCFGNRIFHAWNPWTRTFVKSPPLEKIKPGHCVIETSLGFGYDRLTESYKAVKFNYDADHGLETEVTIHTFGTNFWRRMEVCFRAHDKTGTFASGTLYWIASVVWDSKKRFIVCLDMGKESFQELRLPKLDDPNLTLGVLRDCLCVVSNEQLFWDIWVIKEHGNNMCWTKLLSIPEDRGCFPCNQPRYISEDEEELLPLSSFRDLVVYRRVTPTDKVTQIFYIENSQALILPEMSYSYEPVFYTESLISPCPQY